MRSLYKSLAVISLSLATAWIGACSSKRLSKSNPAIGNTAGAENGDSSGSAGGADDTLADENGEMVNPNDKVAALSSAVGLLNFRQLATTYQALTGVTLGAATSAVSIEYAKQINSLPNDASPAAISASKVSANTKLASVYCDQLSATPALLSAKFPGLNLAAVPADSAAFAATVVNGFYGAEHSLQGPRATDIATVAATVDALKGLKGTGPAIFMATCAAVLSGAEFFLY